MAKQRKEIHRSHFPPGMKFAARLLTVRERNVCLLRLEFEVFFIHAERKQLRSLGKIACRDLIVTAGISHDWGVAQFIQALSVLGPDRPESWFRRAKERPWVKIVFGGEDPEDERNTFESIFPFDVSGHEIFEYDFQVGGKWVGVGAAVEELDTSEATVRRRVDKWEQEWGARLLRRTKGGQRRINLDLLRHLWDTK